MAQGLSVQLPSLHRIAIFTALVTQLQLQAAHFLGETLHLQQQPLHGFTIGQLLAVAFLASVGNEQRTDIRREAAEKTYA